MTRILVVDDEVSIRVTLGKFLRDEGYGVDVAEDAVVASKKLQESDFDIVITDIILPGITGVKLLTSIKKASPDVQVILMTGEPNLETASTAVREGAFDYLAKPMSKELFLKTVSTAAKVKSIDDERRRLERENKDYQENLEQLILVRTKALLESEERMELALHGANLGTWDWNIKSGSMIVNDRFTRMIGLEPHEIEPKITAWAALVHSNDIRSAKKTMSDHLKGITNAYESEYRVRHKSGKWIWILDKGRATERLSSGEPVRVSGTYLDITSRKMAEEDRNRMFQITVERVKELSCLYDVSRAIRQFPDIERVFSEVTALIPQSLQYPDIGRGEIEFLGKSYVAEEFERSPWRLSSPLMVSGKQEGMVHCYYLQSCPESFEGPFLKEERQLVNGVALLLAESIEHRKAQEEAAASYKQLIQADKLISLGVLVSGVAHEINNPNHFVMSHLAPLKRAWEGALPILDLYFEENGDYRLGTVNYTDIRDQIPKIFTNMMEGSQRIKLIVEELKTYVREQPVEFQEEVRINHVVKSATTLLSHMITKATNHFTTKYADGIPLIQGNYQRLEQMIVNIVQNACQALSDPEQAIQISTGWDGSKREIWIEVRDQGCGIAPDNMARLEDPFFTTKREEGGLGLGLSITSNIGREHGGRLEFSSSPDIETTARIILPIKDHS